MGWKFEIYDYVVVVVDSRTAFIGVTKNGGNFERHLQIDVMPSNKFMIENS